jgi:hypothetical protein
LILQSANWFSSLRLLITNDFYKKTTINRSGLVENESE